MTIKTLDTKIQVHRYCLVICEATKQDAEEKKSIICTVQSAVRTEEERSLLHHIIAYASCVCDLRRNGQLDSLLVATRLQLTAEERRKRDFGAEKKGKAENGAQSRKESGKRGAKRNGKRIWTDKRTVQRLQFL